MGGSGGDAIGVLMGVSRSHIGTSAVGGQTLSVKLGRALAKAMTDALQVWGTVQSLLVSLTTPADVRAGVEQFASAITAQANSDSERVELVADALAKGAVPESLLMAAALENGDADAQPARAPAAFDEESDHFGSQYSDDVPGVLGAACQQ